jgi:large conductance mechanosensitive channel
MGMLREFREFALKGNVVDLAVAVIIGGAFGAIVASLVDDVITPLLLTPALEAANAQDLDKLTWGAVKYGKFISAIIKFIIVAFILFLIIKGMNSMKKKDTAAAPSAPPEEILLLREIRDALKNN